MAALKRLLSPLGGRSSRSSSKVPAIPTPGRPPPQLSAVTTQLPNAQIPLTAAAETPPASPRSDTRSPPPDPSRPPIPADLPAPRSLWEKALRALSEQDQRVLSVRSTDVLDALDELIKITKEQKEICAQKQLELTWNGKLVILRNVADQVFMSITRFREIGAIITQHDQVYAALPWAGFRLLLQGIGDDHADMGVILIALEKTSILDRCAIYENLYLWSGRDDPVLQDLGDVLGDMYVAVLQCLATAIGFYGQETTVSSGAGLLGFRQFHQCVDAIDHKASEVYRAAEQADKLYQESEHEEATDETKKLRDILKELDKPIQRLQNEPTRILPKQHTNTDFVAASGRENSAALSTLAEYGVDTSHYGRTMFDALENAATTRQAGNVRDLLSILKQKVKHNRELSAIGANTATAAVRVGSLEVLHTIFEALPGANLDLPSKKWGKTPLHVALERGSSGMANYLISRGANIRLVRNMRIGRLQWAKTEPWFPELQLFLGGIPEGPLLTPEDVLHVQSFLRERTRLPEHIVNSILDLGEYWVHTQCSREDVQTITQYDEQLPYVQLPINSNLSSPVRKIIFYIRSHDQGWTSEEEESRGTYHGSWTWFEAGIVEDTARNSGVSGPAPLGRLEIQRNLTAVGTTTTHIVTWDFRDDKPAAEWMKALVTGQVLGVYPMALYSVWANTVEQINLEVYCAWV